MAKCNCTTGLATEVGLLPIGASHDAWCISNAPSHRERALKNALLVLACAPEMLEMLKLLASSTAVLNHLDTDDNQRLCELIQKAGG